MSDKIQTRMKARKVFLWDIDHTLINCGGAGLRSIAKALHHRFGKRIDTDQSEYHRPRLATLEQAAPAGFGAR